MFNIEFFEMASTALEPIALLIGIITFITSDKVSNFLFKNNKSLLKIFLAWIKSNIINKILSWYSYEVVLSSFTIPKEQLNDIIPALTMRASNEKNGHKALKACEEGKIIKSLRILGIKTKTTGDKESHVILKSIRQRRPSLLELKNVGIHNFFIMINDCLGDIGKRNRVEVVPVLKILGLTFKRYRAKKAYIYGIPFSVGQSGILGSRSYKLNTDVEGTGLEYASEEQKETVESERTKKERFRFYRLVVEAKSNLLKKGRIKNLKEVYPTPGENFVFSLKNGITEEDLESDWEAEFNEEEKKHIRIIEEQLLSNIVSSR